MNWVLVGVRSGGQGSCEFWWVLVGGVAADWVLVSSCGFLWGALSAAMVRAFPIRTH